MGPLSKVIEDIAAKKLPARAKEDDYPVCHDHCFKRIAFDLAVGEKWSDVIERPFYKNASDEQKLAAIVILQLMVVRPEKAHEWQEESLGYR